MSSENIFSNFNFEHIEQFIKFINFLNELCDKNKTNQWIMVIWNIDNQEDCQSICVLNEEHLTLFMNWLIENQEFVWDNERVKTGVDILQELKFVFNPNPIELHKYFMKYKQNHKSILYSYNFLNFIEEISEQRYELNKENIDEDIEDIEDIEEIEDKEMEEDIEDINYDMNNESKDNMNDEILKDMNYDIELIKQFVNINVN